MNLGLDPKNLYVLYPVLILLNLCFILIAGGAALSSGTCDFLLLPPAVLFVLLMSTHNQQCDGTYEGPSPQSSEQWKMIPCRLVDPN